MAVRVLKPLRAASTPAYRDTKTQDERRFYSSGRWTEASKRHRQQEPLCRQCKRNGLVRIGQLTDHILPMSQGGDAWDESNLQTLCNPCHDSKRQRERGQSVRNPGGWQKKS